MSGWTVADTVTNKSLPVGGTNNSGAGVPYVAPAPGFQDPVGKQRVSNPQSLIDTDFEYGPQPTKWESIGIQNYRQSAYYIPQQPLTITAINGSGGATFTLVGTFTLTTGDIVYIQNSSLGAINGWYYVTTGGTNSSVVTGVPGTVTGNGTNYYVATQTYVYKGYFYTNCGFTIGTGGVVVTSASVITVTTTYAHGLSKGSYIYIVGTTGGTNVNGAYVVATVPTANTFTVTAASASGTVTATAGNVNVYARPSGYVEPRSFDGGVSFTAGTGNTGAGVPNQQLIRQTRRYFRYQSGKGIQFSTGSSMKAPLFVSSITGSSPTITVTTRFAHNLAVGSQIQVTGCDQGAYNGIFTVATVTSTTVFTYTAAATPSAATATGPQIRVSPYAWFGSSNRLGFFDQQNGLFFEFDGQQLYAVLRNSTNQINGTVSVTQGQGTVTGTGTQFTTQLNAGDGIVIRGQSYRVLTIISDTSMAISPEYRGQTIAGAIVSRTVDFKYPQSSWTDPLNGTGPSGYNIDLTRMQMWYIDYSWYGAGFIRWGVRASNGQINYVFQLQNNNKQFEAYMRSGNMAAHYESNGIAPVTNLTDNLGTTTTTSADITDASTTIPLTSATTFPTAGYILIGSEVIYYNGKSGNSLINCVRSQFGTAEQAYSAGTTVNVDSITTTNPAIFPANGTVKVTANGVSGTIEYITYTRNINGYLQGLTRGVTGGSAATAFTASTSAPVTVEYGQADNVPSISHWGSSVVMDGRFDDDKSLIFNYGTVSPVTLTASATVPILAIRIAPSVDNGISGLLGNKEIINRMQLQLVELGVITSGPMLINLLLNGYCTSFSGGFASPTTGFTNGFSSSLAQVAFNTTNTASIQGGESVAAAFTNTNGQTTLDLLQVRDLGNSILGGGTTASIPTAQAGMYPDGPDILYVVATNVGAASASILARLSWKEAQA
jgi:hypothetical protein